MAGNIDPITRDVFQQQLVGIAEEMSMALRRAAFSSIIWDMRSAISVMGSRA